MRLLLRILAWLAGIIALLALLLVGSVVVDGLLGGGRVAALTNTSIPNTAGPPVRAYVARPSTPGPHPAVIMIHEFWGLRPELLGKADALAQQGYVVVAPDVFRGSATGWVPRAIWQVISTPNAQVDGDLAAVFGWLSTQPEVQPDRIAMMGFCFGGGTSLRYSLSNPKLAATAVFYGSPISDPARLKALSGPLLGVFGGADVSIPVAEVQAFDAALAQAGVPHQVTIYDNQPHAFVTSIEAIQQGGAPGEAWAQLLAFLDTNLKRNGSATRPSQTSGFAAASGGWMPRALHVFVCDLVVRPG